MIYRRPISTRGALGLRCCRRACWRCRPARRPRAPRGGGGISFRSAPTNLPPGGEGEIIATATNLGYQEIKGETNLDQITTRCRPSWEGPIDRRYATDGVPNEPVPVRLTCTTQNEVQEGHALTLHCPIAHHPWSAGQPLAPHGSESRRAREGRTGCAVRRREHGPGGRRRNGRKQAASARVAATADHRERSAHALSGVEDYKLTPENEDGSTDRQAGSHPFQLTTALDFNQTFELDPNPLLHEFIHRPPRSRRTWTSPCRPACSPTPGPRTVLRPEFSTLLIGGSTLCPADTAVGVSVVLINEPDLLPTLIEAVPVSRAGAG